MKHFSVSPLLLFLVINSFAFLECASFVPAPMPSMTMPVSRLKAQHDGASHQWKISEHCSIGLSVRSGKNSYGHQASQPTQGYQDNQENVPPPPKQYGFAPPGTLLEGGLCYVSLDLPPIKISGRSTEQGAGAHTMPMPEPAQQAVAPAHIDYHDLYVLHEQYDRYPAPELRIAKRLEAIESLLQYDSARNTQSHVVSERAMRVMHMHDIDISTFKTFHGNHLQQVLHGEVIEIFDALYDCADRPLYDLMSTGAYAASELNKQNKLFDAAQLIDWCRSGVEFVCGVAQGCVQGVYEIADCIINFKQKTKEMMRGLVLMCGMVASNSLGEGFPDAALFPLNSEVNNCTRLHHYSAYRPVLDACSQALSQSTSRDYGQLVGNCVSQYACMTLLAKTCASVLQRAGKTLTTLSSMSEATSVAEPCISAVEGVELAVALNTVEELEQVHIALRTAKIIEAAQGIQKTENAVAFAKSGIEEAIVAEKAAVSSSGPMVEPAMKTVIAEGPNAVLKVIELSPHKSIGVIKKDIKILQKTTDHIFSRSHNHNGLIVFESKKIELCEKIVDIIIELDSHGTLVEQGNTIIKMIDGHEFTIRCHIIDGEVMGIDTFLGRSKRTIGKLIDLVPK